MNPTALEMPHRRTKRCSSGAKNAIQTTPTRTLSDDDWFKARLWCGFFWAAASGDRPKNHRPTAMTSIADEGADPNPTPPWEWRKAKRGAGKRQTPAD